MSEKEIANIVKACRKEYYAGESWQDVAEWFGGPRIVMVFAAAGILAYVLKVSNPNTYLLCFLGVNTSKVAK